MAIVDGGPNPIVQPGDKVLLVVPSVDWGDGVDSLRTVMKRLGREFPGVIFVAMEFPGVQPAVVLIYRT